MERMIPPVYLQRQEKKRRQWEQDIKTCVWQAGDSTATSTSSVLQYKSTPLPRLYRQASVPEFSRERQQAD